MSKETRDTVVDKLDVRGLSLLIFMCVVEFEVFVFARAVIEVSEQDAWISILIGTAFLALNAYIMVLLANRFPRETFFEYCPKIWGKPAALVIKVLYLVYWFTTLMIILKDFSIANETLYLPRTPNLIPILLIGFGAFWAVSYGLTGLVRFFQLMFWFSVLPLLLVVVLGIAEIRLDNFKPVFAHDLFTLVKGGLLFAAIYQGLEIILIAGPFFTETKKMVKPAILGVLAGTFFPFTLGLSAIGSLGVQTVKTSIWSGIDTVSTITLPGFPVERYELFLTMPWLVALFTTICIFLYLVTYGIQQAFGVKHRALTSGIVILLAIAATYPFPDYACAMLFREYLSLATIVFISIIPISTWILAVIRRKGEVG